jgi:glycerol uptake facilitator-like aquaporin
MGCEFCTPKKLVAEFIGTMGLIIAVIGSVMLVELRFGASDPVFKILLQGAAGGFILFAMIEALGKISGGHFNPAVTLAMIVSKGIQAKDGLLYIVAQILGGVAGVFLLNITFYDYLTQSLFYVSENSADSVFLIISEFLCAFLLVAIVFGCVRSGSRLTSLAVGLFVGGMIMATASTFFANPAVDIARIFTEVACGISPITALYYIIAAFLGALASAGLFFWLYPKEQSGEECESD